MKGNIANKVFNAFTALYVVAAFVYGMYGVVAQTGLPGQLVSLQLRWFGVASSMFTAVLAIGIYLAPLIPMWSVFRSFVPESYPAAVQPVSTVLINGRQVTDPAPHLNWKATLLVSGVLFAITFVAAGYYYYADKANESATVHAIDLDASATIPLDTKFMELTGHWARRLISSYREGTTVHVFIPVTAAKWTAADPVEVLVHVTTTSSEGTRPTLPSELAVPRPVSFPGRVRGPLPVVVLQDLAAQGAKIAPSYLVVDRTELVNHRVPASDTYLVILGFGSLLAVLMGITMMLARMMAFSREKRSR